jgi:hypothetical protein
MHPMRSGNAIQKKDDKQYTCNQHQHLISFAVSVVLFHLNIKCL